MLSNSRGFRINDGRDKFDKDFNFMSKLVKIVFVVAFTMIIGIWGVYAFIGVKVYNTVQDNGGIATTAGKFYKEFNEASK